MAQYAIAPPPTSEPLVNNERKLTLLWNRWWVALQDQFLYRWDDLRFPADGINPPGAASDPTRSTTTGLLEFSGIADNVIAGVAQMPHAWAAGTPVHPHLHLRFTTSTAGAVNTRWLFEYDIANVNDDFVNASGTYTTLSTMTVPNPHNVNKHVIAAWPALDMAGKRESAVILWRISRLAASDPLDDDGAACEMLEFDIHHQINKWGTIVEYPGA